MKPMEYHSIGFFILMHYVVKICYFRKGFAHLLFLKSKNLYL